MVFVQYIFGFMSLGWQIYKYVKEQEKDKMKRKEICADFGAALRKAKQEKDTSELEDMVYKLGFSGGDFSKHTTKLQDK